ncbi:winged helix-turn-helix transcriptional regulator [Marinobacter sp. NP-6]|uniref:LuxR C-terminal-related transcriptional regulator n=1 Tax=Marinobacter sp. NP-6 TaxID=2488666 RepID=UPI000FCC4EEC|nr:LuxR C-terminal-related transcriptional regulator [Marinobacter sp. NP-6]RUT76908.1 winged helix-turn-helix transcriptional regulator [Marinobacter sp. NP-6]
MAMYTSTPTKVCEVETDLLKTLSKVHDDQPKVLCLIAPFGFDKTVFMSQLCSVHERAGRACLWTALDDAPAGFRSMVQSLIASVGSLHSNAPENPTPLHDEMLADDLINELITALNSLTQPSTIFIDDLNHCDEVELGSLLDALIFRTNPTVRLVCASRTMPTFNYADARLAGQIRLINPNDLSVSGQDIKKMLGAELTCQLGFYGIEKLLQLTEGWSAGLRMARVVLETSNEDPKTALADLSGSDEDFAAMFDEHVMQTLPLELRTFICSLADLNNFDAEMCEYVIGTTLAPQQFQLLVRQNVFLVPLDRHRKRYRFHRLFQSYLRGEAQRYISTDQRRRILVNAMDWCEKRQRWQDSINYALAAEEYAKAGYILENKGTSMVYEQGELQQFIHSVDQLQVREIKLSWEVHFWFVWALVLTRKYTSAVEQFDRLARQQQSTNFDEHPPEDMAQRMDYLRICLDLLNDRINDAYQNSERWLDTVERCAPYFIGSVYSMQAICHANTFRLAEARRTMRTANHIELASGSAHANGWTDLIHGTISLYEGNFLTAQQDLSSGLAKTRKALGDDSELHGVLALAAAACHVELGDEAEARQLLLRGSRISPVHGLVDTAAFGFEAAVKLWNGNPESAQFIDHLRDIAASYPPRLSVMLTCYLIQRLLRLGRHQEAFEEASSNDLDIDTQSTKQHQALLQVPRFRDLHNMVCIELDIARGFFDEASKKIAHTYGVALKNKLFARLVELDQARLKIAIQTGNSTAATKALLQAITIAAPRGIVRPFTDNAEALSTLINQTRPSVWNFARNQERVFFANLCEKLPINSLLNDDLEAPRVKDRSPRIDLTPKERELLVLLDAGLSNQQIAEHIHISITTVKWHLKNVYRKLNVNSRLAALSQARTEGLLNY